MNKNTIIKPKKMFYKIKKKKNTAKFSLEYIFINWVKWINECINLMSKQTKTFKCIKLILSFDRKKKKKKNCLHLNK